MGGVVGSMGGVVGSNMSRSVHSSAEYGRITRVVERFRVDALQGDAY